ncbi:hypothetical protein PPYR_04688 [Photinus pyralis]|uniref:Calcyclin-binding protein n=1 Tax=Photinus pyralis TaxID=7054 RepID=A0A1Y1M5A7_PHOPY|nr:calcyclin-binding protein [Photinus pyralis]KAB0802502.1 hypothetical protein PPYR_04688 [Photinus pyralis]
MEELMQDVAELELLQKQAKRQRIKNILTVELNRQQAELGRLQAEIQNTEKVTKPAVIKRYQVKLTNYAWDQTSKFVKFYVTLKNVQNIPAENITCSFTAKSLELSVKDLEGKDYLFTINHLLMQINPADSVWRVKSDTIIINAAKVEQKNWEFVTEIEKRASDAKKLSTPNPDASADPSEGLMSLMKNMYEQGDDEMKRTIAKAMHESQTKKGAL